MTPEEQPVDHDGIDAELDADDPAMAPMDVDGVSAVTLGTLAFTIAFVVLYVFYRDQLEARDDMWWLWTCLAGAGLGVVGIAYTTKRRRVYREARLAEREARRAKSAQAAQVKAQAKAQNKENRPTRAERKQQRGESQL